VAQTSQFDVCGAPQRHFYELNHLHHLTIAGSAYVPLSGMYGAPGKAWLIW
jgi:hypothetical protein